MSPSLELAIEMQSSVANGESIRTALVRFVGESQEEFARLVRRFLIAWDQSQDLNVILREIHSPYRRSLLELAGHGLNGQSIHVQLIELQKEIEVACEEEMKLHIDLLPLKMLCPLLLFQFPAFILVLFGPLLSRFIEELSR